MKKLFLSLLMVFMAIINVQAYDCVKGEFTAEDGGNYFGTMILDEDCTFTITTVDDEEFSGTYTIDGFYGEISKGDEYVIVFKPSGRRSYEGKYVWEWSEDNECVQLDGMVFQKTEKEEEHLFKRN